MPNTRQQMHRRAFLAGSVAVGIGLSTAGCLSRARFWSSDDVVLDEPEYYDQLRSSRDEGHLDHPIHGDELPEATVPDALGDGAVTTTEFVGDRHVLLTFIFSRCTMACPLLTSNLAQVQGNAMQDGYDDEFAFMPTTFDPEYDTPDVLSEYSEDLGAAIDEENWHFLRPETEDDAQEVVNETFGVRFEWLSEEDREMGEDMAFEHTSSIILANEDGYVERNYTNGRVPNAAGLLQDIETFRERW